MNYQEADGTWKQIGITSFVLRGCTLGAPSGFTRIRSYRAWIDSVVRQNSAVGYCSSSASRITFFPAVNSILVLSFLLLFIRVV